MLWQYNRANRYSPFDANEPIVRIERFVAANKLFLFFIEEPDDNVR